MGDITVTNSDGTAINNTKIGGKASALSVGNVKTITMTAPAMTAAQKEVALDYAAARGMTKEYNLIKSLTINISNPISDVAEVVGKALDIIKFAIGA